MLCASSLSALTISAAVSSTVFISGLSVINFVTPTIEIHFVAVIPSSLSSLDEAACESMVSESIVKLL